MSSSSVKNILSKRFSTYFFTHIHLMRCLSSMVNLIAAMMSGLHRCWQKLFKNTKYFHAIRISMSLAILSEMFIQVSYFF